MALETERKFLVKGDYKAEAYKAMRITQAYLSHTALSSVRIRIRDNQGFITIKGKTDAAGMSRYEWEKEIPVQEAKELLLLATPGQIDKCRYLVRNTDGKHIWEVDEFYGENEGLTVAEIELSSEDEPFDKPSWLGEEVTGDPRYFNSALRKNPYKNWK